MQTETTTDPPAKKERKKRQRTVFQVNELFHQWAHQLVPFGTTKGVLEFNGKSLYSKGYEIARILDDGSYLVSQHQYPSWHMGGDARNHHRISAMRSIPHGSTVHRAPDSYVCNRTLDLSAEAWVQEHLIPMQTSWKMATTSGTHYDGRQLQLESIERVWLDWVHAIHEKRHIGCPARDSRIFEIACKAEVLASDPDFIKKVEQSIARKQARYNAWQQDRERERREWAEKQAATRPDRIQTFRDGGYSSLNDLEFQLMRVQGTPEEPFVYTSMGASVPLNHALLAYKVGKLRGWRALLGRHCGPFTITTVGDSHLVIGCHKFEFSEIESVLEPHIHRLRQSTDDAKETTTTEATEIQQ